MDIFYKILDGENVNKYQIHHKEGRNIVDWVGKNVYKIENTELEIINNKPKYKYADKFFSITHSENIVAVAFDDVPVGLDIELIKDRDYKSIAKRMKFDLKEDTIEEFYKCWTLFEAEYKLGCQANAKISEIFNEKYMLSVVSAGGFINLEFNKIKSPMQA